MTLNILLFLSILLLLITSWWLQRFSKKLAIGCFLVGLGTIGLGYTYRKTIYRYYAQNKADVRKKISIPTCQINSKVLKFKRDNYTTKHRAQAHKLDDIKPVETNAERDAYVEKGVLVPLKNTDGWIVKSMDYGSPFVHSKLYQKLKLIEQRFAEKQQEHNLSGIQFVISSAYRTVDDQERLRKVNKNATVDSSHSYGASVDISHIRGKDCEQATELFQETLNELQKEKQLWLCPESITMHVTLRE